jgi:hypothetical protein
MNKNLASLNKWEQLCSQSIRNQFKSQSTGQNLAFLDETVNGIHGQLLMHLLGDKIYKIKPSITYTKKYQSNGKDLVEEFYQYGHVQINNQPIRVSSCLDIQHQMIQYPIEEQQYLKNGQYNFFTCGDLYLLVINSLLDESMYHIKTEKKNYEVNISALFELGAVFKFGLIDFDNKTYEDEIGIHTITKQLPAKFLQAHLRGCMIGKKPHYILARLENSGSAKHFDYELWTNYRDIYFAYRSKNAIRTWQAYGLQARKNTEKILNREKWEFTNLVNKSPGVIKVRDNVHFMIFDYQQVNDIEMIRKYCHKVYTKYYAN